MAKLALAKCDQPQQQGETVHLCWAPWCFRFTARISKNTLISSDLNPLSPVSPFQVANSAYLRQCTSITRQPSFVQPAVQRLSEREGIALNFSKVSFTGRGKALHVFECKLNDLGMQVEKMISYCAKKKNRALSYIIPLRQHLDASLDVLFCRNADG